MEENKYQGTGFILVGLIVGCCITWGIMKYNQTQTKYKMNLKCIQGELYEEIRPHFYVKSHLECFEQKTLVP
jgi:hypothetical protein